MCMNRLDGEKLLLLLFINIEKDNMDDFVQ